MKQRIILQTSFFLLGSTLPTTAFTLVERPRRCAPTTLHGASPRNNIFPTTLQYRAHDEEDDELSTHKLRTRASPLPGSLPECTTGRREPCTRKCPQKWNTLMK